VTGGEWHLFPVDLGNEFERYFRATGLRRNGLLCLTIV
jgi:hypothetical protein